MRVHNSYFGEGVQHASSSSMNLDGNCAKSMRRFCSCLITWNASSLTDSLNRKKGSVALVNWMSTADCDDTLICTSDLEGGSFSVLSDRGTSRSNMMELQGTTVKWTTSDNGPQWTLAQTPYQYAFTRQPTNTLSRYLSMLFNLYYHSSYNTLTTIHPTNHSSLTTIHP